MMTVSIPSVTAVVALAASAAVGAHAGAVEVGVLRGDDTLEVGVQPQYEVAVDELDTLKSVPGWESYVGIPVVGTMTMQDPALNGDHEMTIGDFRSGDSRDSNSLYVCTIQASTNKPIVLLSEVESGGLLLQVVENRSGSGADKTDGWYLAAHNYYENDAVYPGYVRLIGHRDVNKAAVFKFVNHNGKQVLQIKENRAGSGSSTVGLYLSIPPDAGRDDVSSFVAVGPSIIRAVSVSMKPAQRE